MKVYAAGVNPVDTYIRSGIHEVKPALPYTPGWDMAGIIEDVGADVKSLKVSSYSDLSYCVVRCNYMSIIDTQLYEFIL